MLLVILGLVLWGRKSLRRGVGNIARSTALAAGNTRPTAQGSSREVTAEQLAGSLNRNPAAPTTGAGRTRRPRRTPSQISTISLPAYMKEPGDQELVIFRYAYSTLRHPPGRIVDALRN